MTCTKEILKFMTSMGIRGKVYLQSHVVAISAVTETPLPDFLRKRHNWPSFKR